jgi:hypothetical protein
MTIYKVLFFVCSAIFFMPNALSDDELSTGFNSEAALFILKLNESSTNRIPSYIEGFSQIVDGRMLNKNLSVNLKPFSDWDYYYLTHSSLVWLPNKPEQPAKVEVPVGFVTDLTSIPSVFWFIARPEGKYAYAAIVHDYLYWIQDRPREEADLIFKIALQDSGVSELRVSLIFAAVRSVGGQAWNKNKILKSKGERRILKRLPDDFTISWSYWKSQEGVFAD